MYLVRRLAQMLALLAVLSLGLFYLLHLMPGSAEDLLIAGRPDVTAEDVARLRRLRGLDRPIHVRYACWLAGRPDAPIPDDAPCAWWPAQGVLHGDLGYSRIHKVPVAEIIGERAGNTLRLMLPALLLAFAAALILGTWAAMRRGRLLDRAIAAATFAGIALPMHWAGMMAILVLSVGLGWFPPSGINDPRDPGFWPAVHHALLPVLVLATHYAARWTRYTRAALLDAAAQEHLKAARAKGLPERTVVVRHALGNALVPIVTVAAQSIPSLFSGALVIERVFAYPGMSILIFDSVLGDDHLVAITAFLIFAALTMSATLLADLLYVALDPRLRTRRPA